MTRVCKDYFAGGHGEFLGDRVGAAKIGAKQRGGVLSRISRVDRRAGPRIGMARNAVRAGLSGADAAHSTLPFGRLMPAGRAVARGESVLRHSGAVTVRIWPLAQIQAPA